MELCSRDWYQNRGGNNANCVSKVRNCPRCRFLREWEDPTRTEIGELWSSDWY